MSLLYSSFVLVFVSLSSQIIALRHTHHRSSTHSDADDDGITTADDCNDNAYVVWEEGASYDQHETDADWYGSSGPATCFSVDTESVQSVGTLHIHCAITLTLSATYFKL
jgi:hypothetical protein